MNSIFPASLCAYFMPLWGFFITVHIFKPSVDKGFELTGSPYFEILEPTKLTIAEAYNSDFTDIEDAIQYFMAKNAGLIDYIITRNIKDYQKENNGIPVVTPTQFLKQHAK